MKLSNYYFLLITILLFASFSKSESSFGIEKNVIITGKIGGFDPELHPNTMELSTYDILGIKPTYTTTIDSSGYFKLSFPIAYTREVSLNYAGLPLIVRPGDSLHITTDNEFLQQEDTEGNFVHFQNDEIGKTNLAVYKFKCENFDIAFDVRNDDAVKNLSPKKYIEFIYNQNSVLKENFDKYIKDHKTTPLFRAWCNDKIHYLTLHELMQYRWKHPNNYQLPNDYFSFLDDYDINDNQLFSTRHSLFLHELYMYNWDKPVINAMNSREHNYKIVIDTMKANSTGFTQEFLLTKVYMNTLNGQLIDIFETIYDSTNFHQPYFKNAIDNKYEELKNYLSNQNTENINLTTIQSQTLEELLDTITQKYQNKVIYVDFWAPWCGPCMEEMQYSKEIIEIYKDNDDIVFLFLANGCTIKSWKATIANKKLTGEHILLTDEQYNLFADMLDFSGIPHYTLIDKNANIVLKDAPRPSEKDIIIKEIERQLNK